MGLNIFLLAILFLSLFILIQTLFLKVSSLLLLIILRIFALSIEAYNITLAYNVYSRYFTHHCAIYLCHILLFIESNLRVFSVVTTEHKVFKLTDL